MPAGEFLAWHGEAARLAKVMMR
jgi:hypothetical protein